MVSRAWRAGSAALAALSALAVGAHAESRLPQAEGAAFRPLGPGVAMPGFGAQAQLGPSEIEDLTEYVLALSGRATDAKAVGRAIPLYEAHCAACHGLAGEGNSENRTPDLSDDAWIYGGSREAIRNQIWRGDDGRGPGRHAFGPASAPPKTGG
ncbi:MAG: c-type cytochrome [Phenylobacterium sp.]|uniref:c-type cytochrome n=1 Tax=Phenylobacterium sp. TaxID=1871053 RepID=UPI00391BBBCF